MFLYAHLIKAYVNTNVCLSNRVQIFVTSNSVIVPSIIHEAKLKNSPDNTTINIFFMD